MNRLQFFVIGLIVGCLPILARAEGTLYYDATTGEVFFELDVPEDRFITFDIRSHSSQLVPDNFIRLGDPTILVHLENDYIVDNAGLGTFKPEGLYGLGPIYPPNVSPADFLADVSSTWGSEASTMVVPFEIAFARPAGIPQNDPTLTNLDELWATEAELRYSPTTGDLLISSNGYLSGIALQASDAVVFEDVEIPWATDNFYLELHPEAIFAVGLMEPGQYELGSVLPQGLSLQQFSDSLAGARFWGEAGVGQTDFRIASGDAVQLALVYVPEPS